MDLTQQLALCRLLHGPAAELNADLDALLAANLVRHHHGQYALTDHGRSTILNTPERWYDLPKTYRRFRLGHDWGLELVGLELDIFLPTLSGFYPAPMGLADAAKYLFYHHAQTYVVWVNDDGRETRNPCNVHRHHHDNTIAVYTYSGNLVIAQAHGLPQDTWFDNSGGTLHEITPDGNRKPHGLSFSSYRQELQAARNRLGITSVRDYPNNRIAEKYILHAGDTVRLLFPMPVYSTSDPPSPVTTGHTYTLIDGPKYGHCTITTDHPNQTIKVKRGQIVKVPQECW